MFYEDEAQESKFPRAVSGLPVSILCTSARYLECILASTHFGYLQKGIDRNITTKVHVSLLEILFSNERSYLIASAKKIQDTYNSAEVLKK